MEKKNKIETMYTGTCVKSYFRQFLKQFQIFFYHSIFSGAGAAQKEDGIETLLAGFFG